jgi:HEAT repeat protein
LVEGITILDAGLAQGRILGKDPDTGLTVTDSTSYQIAKSTDRVPALLGYTFAVKYRIEGRPGGEVPVTVSVLAPHTERDAASAEPRVMSQWVHGVGIGQIAYDGFVFETKAELIPGEWTIRLFVNDRMAAEKRFTVYRLKPGEIDAGEERAFQQASEKETAEAYQMFLTKYPRTFRRDLVEFRLLDLASYKAALAKDDVASYESYLWQYADGRHRKQVAARIAKLERALYEKADTAWGYEAYLRQHPDASDRAEVESRLESLGYERAAAEDTIASFDDFLSRFPAGHRSQKARERLAAIRSDKAVFEEVAEADRLEGYEEFLRQYPANRYADTARERVAQQMIERITRASPQEILRSQSGSGAAIATVYVRNPLSDPLTIFLSGPEHIDVSLNPGESGRLEFLSGLYRIAIRRGPSGDVGWAASNVTLSGRDLLLFDGPDLPAALIGVDQSFTRYPVPVPERRAVPPSGPERVGSAETIRTYHEEIDRATRERDERVATQYPLKRSPSTPLLLRNMRSGERSGAVSALGRVSDHAAFQALLSLLADRELGPSAIDALPRVREAIWPLIAVIKLAADTTHPVARVNPGLWRITSGWYVLAENFSDPRAQAAAEALASIGDGVAQAVMESFRYFRVEDQIGLVILLGRVARPEHEPFLVHLLKTGDPETRQAALQTLLPIATSKSAPAVLDWADEAIGSWKDDAFWVLGSLADTDPGSIPITLDNSLRVMRAYEKIPAVARLVDRKRTDDAVLNSIDAQGANALVCAIVAENPMDRDLERLLRCLRSQDDPTKKAMALGGIGRLRATEAVSPVIEVLQSTTDVSLRRQSLATLGLVGSPQAIEAMVTLSKSSAERTKALQALARSGSPSIGDVLVKLDEEDPSLSFDCRVHLGSRPEAVPSLQRALKTGNERIRHMALNCLSGINHETATHALSGIVISSSGALRKAAIGYLFFQETAARKRDAPRTLLALVERDEALSGEIIGFLGEEKVTQAIPAVRRAFNRELAKGQTPYRAIEALSQLGDQAFLEKAVSPLSSVIRGGKKVDRRAALTVLGKIGGDRAVDALIELLNDSDNELVARAVDTLGYLGSRRATRPLIQLIHDRKDESPEVFTSTNTYGFMASVVASLGRIRDPEAVDALVGLLNDTRLRKGSILYDSILSALNSIDDPHAELVLVKELRTASPSDRTKAAFHSDRWANKHPESVKALATVLRDGTPTAKLLAVDILRNFRSQEAVSALAAAALEPGDIGDRAIWSLGTIGEPALGALLKLLRNETVARLWPHIVGRIGDIKTRSALVPLVRFQRTSGVDVGAAVWSIVVDDFPELFIPPISLEDVRQRLQAGKRSGGQRAAALP